MDWARAKTILILVLILLNIFLIAAISIYKFEGGVPRETINNALEILRSRGVEIKCDIPTYSKDMPSLVGGNNGVDRSAVASRLLGRPVSSSEAVEGAMIVNESRSFSVGAGSGFTFSDTQPSVLAGLEVSSEIERTLRKYLSELQLNISDFVLDGEFTGNTGEKMLVFTEKYKSLLVFDNRIEVTLVSNAITRIESTCKKIKGFSQHKMQIMPAHQILLKNYKEKVSPVTSIELGFKGFIKGELNVKESSEGPAWRISTADGQMRYFKATDGEEID